MAIDAAIASSATNVIRDATGSARSTAEWERVEALVGGSTLPSIAAMKQR